MHVCVCVWGGEGGGGPSKSPGVVLSLPPQQTVKVSFIGTDIPCSSLSGHPDLLVCRPVCQMVLSTAGPSSLSNGFVNCWSVQFVKWSCQLLVRPVYILFPRQVRSLLKSSLCPSQAPIRPLPSQVVAQVKSLSKSSPYLVLAKSGRCLAFVQPSPCTGLEI